MSGRLQNFALVGMVAAAAGAIYIVHAQQKQERLVRYFPTISYHYHYHINDSQLHC
jgi:hypothetical protein